MRKSKFACALSISLIVLCLFAGCAAEREKCGFEGCPGDAQITTNVESRFQPTP